MTAGYAASECSSVPIAWMVFPSPMSSAMKHLRALVAYLIPAFWYGSSLPLRVGISSSASLAFDAMIVSSRAVLIRCASVMMSSGISRPNVSPNAMAWEIDVSGTLQLLVFVSQVMPGTDLAARTFTGSYEKLRYSHSPFLLIPLDSLSGLGT